MGLLLTAVMILVFLGSLRGTFSVLLSIPLSCLAAFLLLKPVGGTINTMVLGGLALVLSRLIDNSVVVLENIFRHLEAGRGLRNGSRRRRQRSCPGSAGRHLHHRHRLLPGSVPVWRQQVSCSPRWPWGWCWRWRLRISSP